MVAKIVQKLDTDDLLSDFFHNTRLLGIVAPLKDYSFIWNINQALAFNFRSTAETTIQLKKKNRDYYFNTYTYLPPGTEMYHLLYENQHDGEYLLPEFKHLDFLWLIKECTMSNEEFSGLQMALKNIPAVQFVNEMTNEKIRHKNHLLI